MGQIVYNADQIQSIAYGTTEIKEVWVGNVKIWPTSTTTGGTVEGQSGFVFDVTPVTISKISTSGTTNTTIIKFNADGTMAFDAGTTITRGTENISWNYWNTNVGALVNPRVDFNLAGLTPGFTDIQVSIDQGSTWTTIQETGSDGAGPLEGYPLFPNGVWIRLPISSATSFSKTVPNIFVQYWNNGQEVPFVLNVSPNAIDLTITSGVIVASNPFVADFGSLSSSVTVPAGQQATSYCRIFGPTHPNFPGKIEIIPFGGEGAVYYNWIVPGQTAPSGTYTVRLDDWENLEPLVTQPTNGYSLPSSGEFEFSVVQVETGASFKTGSGSVAIKKDGITVSAGGVTLRARSQGASGGQ